MGFLKHNLGQFREYHKVQFADVFELELSFLLMAAKVNINFGDVSVLSP